MNPQSLSGVEASLSRKSAGRARPQDSGRKRRRETFRKIIRDTVISNLLQRSR
jgi:hypothetical protein